MEVKLLTIDVWDTILRRKCHPDAVKVHVSSHLLNNNFAIIRPEYRDSMKLFQERQATEGRIAANYLSSGMDDEYRQLEVYREWLQIVLSNKDSIDAITSTLEAVEIEQEKHVIYADPGIETFLTTYPCRDRVFVSDFYMSAQIITEFVKYAGLGHLVDRGYSSCDHYLNKRSGRFFRLVLEKENVDAGSTFHIGDNLHSDVRMPERHGLAAIAYQPKAESDLRATRKEEFDSRPGSVAKLFDKQRAPFLPSSGLSGTARQLYEYGEYCAPLVVGFMLFVMERAIRQEHEKIYFFTREGEFFKRVYDRLRALQPLGQLAPPSEILEVSRLATFSPSLRSFTPEELMRIWTLYSTQSVAALLKSMNIEGEGALIHLARHGIDEQESIQFPWLDQKVLNLFNDASFLNFLTVEVSEKKIALLQYLEQRGLSDLTQCAAVVDIGWRGTIQDNLSYLIPNCHFDGYYIGLNKFLNDQPSNTSKTAFGPDLNSSESEHCADLFAAVAPLEMLCNSSFGSVIGYNVGKGRACAERIVDDAENNVVDRYVTHFQRGVVESAERLSEIIRVHAISSVELRPMGIQIWESIIRKPNSAVVHAYFQLNHNEQFGVGGFSDKSGPISLWRWCKALLLPSGLRNLIRALEGTGWPEGYLHRRNILFLWSVVSLSRRWKNRFNGQGKS
jgi:predicted HAD superfamily hydrolase